MSNGVNLSAQDLLTTPLLDGRKFQHVEFYDFLEDQKGFLWMGSNHGVFRYDGVHWVNYIQKDSIVFNDVLSVFEDKVGRVWFATFRRGLFYYDYHKNEILVPPWNNKLMELSKGSWVSDLFIAPDHSIWIQKFSFGIDTVVNLFQIKDDSLIQHELSKHSNLTSFLQQVVLTTEQQALFQQIKRQLVVADTIFVSNRFLVDSLRLGINKNSLVSYNALFPNKRQNGKNAHIVRKIIKINAQELLGLMYNGFVKYPNTKDATVFLPEYQINDICKLSNGNYLFSTDQHGVLVSSSIEIKKHNFEQNEVTTAIHAENEKLYIKTKGKIYCKSSLSPHPELLFSIDAHHRNISIPSRFTIWDNDVVFNNMVLFDGQQTKILAPSVQRIVRGRSKSMVAINDSLLIVSTADGFITLNKDLKMLTNSQALGYNTWTYTSAVTAPNKLWLGTINGIIEYDYKKASFKPIAMPVENMRIKDIKGKKERCIFAASLMHGLLIFPPSQKTISVRTKEGLNSTNVTHILLEKDTIAWVGTSNGINKVVFSPYNNKVDVSSYLTGLAIVDLALVKDTIFAVGDGQLLSFPKNMAPLTKKKTSILLTTLRVNGKEQAIQNENVVLERNENTIQINFTNVKFDKERTTLFCYALLPENSRDTIWQYTTEYSVNYAQLMPGEYTFLLTTETEKNKSNPSIQHLNINIQKLFVDTIYFQLLIYCLIVLATSSIAWIVILVTKRRAELEKALVESQLKLLRTQMNPHFLFNTLSSIQGHIMMQNMRASTIYLSYFAKLVRDILENSKHSFLPLSKELSMLETYISLERLRLGDAYSISIEQNIQMGVKSFYIPPMFIQPFIENAIIHGLKPQGGGEIIVTVEKVCNELIKILIVDNGIGREAAQKKSTGYAFTAKTSLGIATIKEHIFIINRTYQMDIKLSIEDLYDEDGFAKGTSVQILLPKFDYLTYMKQT
ncbi:sensor histidine kinase [Aureispira anguillae]|uniref:Histidine kinase n=1 Tax=Aureispira anguillae TaxID=2864201 RepID=A0A916DXC3_9BACT|nr:histidine kinase [Aureispira anguillae]BDS15610.1 histidine kinase [Aureispira anguillae]